MFQPGVSGNPSGRPKGWAKKKNELERDMRAALSSGDRVAMWKAVIREARKGNIAHLRLWCDYDYGKPLQTIDQTLNVDDKRSAAASLVSVFNLKDIVTLVDESKVKDVA